MQVWLSNSSTATLEAIFSGIGDCAGRIQSGGLLIMDSVALTAFEFPGGQGAEADLTDSDLGYFTFGDLTESHDKSEPS